MSAYSNEHVENFSIFRIPQLLCYYCQLPHVSYVNLSIAESAQKKNEIKCETAARKVRFGRARIVLLDRHDIHMPTAVPHVASAHSAWLAIGK